MTEESVPLLRLRCPYGRHGESTGDWSRGDAKNWETSVSVSSAERERLGPDQLPDGEFYLSFPDFIATFTAIECVHLDAETSRDEPTLQGRGNRPSLQFFENLNFEIPSVFLLYLVPWITRVYQGCWQRGVTAGGCRNNSGNSTGFPLMIGRYAGIPLIPSDNILQRHSTLIRNCI